MIPFSMKGIMATTLTSAKSVVKGREYYDLVYDVTTTLNKHTEYEDS